MAAAAATIAQTTARLKIVEAIGEDPPPSSPVFFSENLLKELATGVSPDLAKPM